jgi:hypothetical protein
VLRVMYDNILVLKLMKKKRLYLIKIKFFVKSANVLLVIVEIRLISNHIFNYVQLQDQVHLIVKFHILSKPHPNYLTKLNE